MDFPDVDYLCDLAIEAGDIIRDYFGRTKADLKEDRTPVTIADTTINQMVIDSISRDFPNISVIAEEGNHKVKNAEYRVLCDPMDGTLPFIWDIPIASFCIAVVRDSTPIAGVIYDPFQDRMWHAGKGEGAFLDENLIEVSQCSLLADSAICMSWWKNTKYNLHEVCAKLMAEGANWFNPASIAYAGGLLAMGKIDATIFPGQNGWETAAMQVIVQEAGGKVTDIFGQEMVYSPEGDISGHIISNGLLHDELVALVKSCQ